MRIYSLLSEAAGTLSREIEGVLSDNHAQGALEYLAIIGAIIAIVTVVTLVVKTSMYKPALDAEAGAANQTFESAQ